MLSLSILVLFVGMYLNRKIRFLGDNYIPPAVTGGLLFAVGTVLIYVLANKQVQLDMRIRDLLLLVFFSTVGLSARFKTLLGGGKALLVLAITAGVFLALQNTLGIGIAMLTGHHPGPHRGTPFALGPASDSHRRIEWRSNSRSNMKRAIT